MDLMLTKTATGFAPADQASSDAWKKLPRGTVLRAKITRARNLKFHRKFWALATVTHDNLPDEMAARFPTVEALVMALKLATGRFDMLTTVKGLQVPVPHSISFARMDEDTFSAFYEDCIRVICTHVIPGIDDAELRDAAVEDVGTFT